MARLGPPIQGFAPSCRLACLALLSSAVLFAHWGLALGLGIAAYLASVAEGVKPLSLLRELSIVLYFAIFGALATLLGFESGGAAGGYAAALGEALGETAAYAARLAGAYLLGRLLYASTSVSQLRDAVTGLTRRLPGLRKLDLGMQLSLVLGFVPMIFSEWEASREAARSRGMPAKAGPKLQAAFLAAFVRRLMIRSAQLPDSLAARGWTRERATPPLAWRKRDFVALLTSVCFLANSLLRHVY